MREVAVAQNLGRAVPHRRAWALGTSPSSSPVSSSSRRHRRRRTISWTDGAVNETSRSRSRPTTRRSRGRRASTSSGRRTSVVRPAQYTAVAASRSRPRPAPRRTRASLPTGTSRPAPRSRRGEADREAVELRCAGTGRAGFRHCVPSPCRTSCSQPRRLVRSWSSRYFRIVPSVTSTDVLVDGRAAERGQRVRPVDGLGHARRLVELELAQRLDRRGHLAGERVGNLGRPHAQDGELALEVGVRDPVVEAPALRARRARHGCGST